MFAGPNAHVSSSTPSQKKHAMAKQVGKKENATLQQWIEILDWHYANGKVQTKTEAFSSSLSQPLPYTATNIGVAQKGVHIAYRVGE